MWRGRGGEGRWGGERVGGGEGNRYAMASVKDVAEEAMWELYVQVYLPSIDCSCCRQDFGTFHPVC